MADIKQKLEEYRERKKRQPSSEDSSSQQQDATASASSSQPSSSSPSFFSSLFSSSHQRDQAVIETAPQTWTQIILKVVLYGLLQTLFNILEFGSIFFILSCFYFIHATMEHNAAKRAKGQKSAYSVFNKGFEAIDGTFDIKQFEKELRFGAGAVGK